MHTPDGEEVQVIKTVAPEWQMICVQMNFDPIGCTMDLIAKTERGDPVSCCQSAATMYRHINILQSKYIYIYIYTSGNRTPDSRFYSDPVRCNNV